MSLKDANEKLGKLSLNQKTKTLVLISLGLIVLMGVLVALVLTAPKEESSDDVSSAVSSEEEQDASIPLISKSESDLKYVKVVNSYATMTIEKKSDGGYEMQEYPNLPLQDSYIDYLWNTGITLSALEELEAEGGLDYGLSKPQAEVDFVYNSGEIHVKVGSLVAGRSGQYYILVDGDDKIYVASIHGKFFDSPEFFCSQKIVVNSSSSDVVDNIVLTGFGLAEPVNFQLNPDKSDSSSQYYGQDYLVSIGDSTTVYGGNNNYCNNLFYQLREITANKALVLAPSDDVKAQYGLLTPSGTADFDYTSSSDTVGHTLYIGDTKDAFTYFMFDDIDAIYQIQTANIYNIINPSIDEIRSEYIMMRLISDINRMTIAFDGASYAVDFALIEDGYTALYNGTELDLDNYQNFFQSIITMTAVGYSENAVSDTPALTITLDYSNGTQTEVFEFFQSDAVRQYVCKINGQGDMCVSESIISRIKSNTERLVSGKNIVTY